LTYLVIHVTWVTPALTREEISPVLPFSRSPVLPFSRSPVLPFSRSPVRTRLREEVDGLGGVFGMSATVENVRECDAVAITPPAEREESLAVIVPVYNEERTVAELLRRLEVQPCVSQIIIVDDGSTDRTWEELEPWRARACLQMETAGSLCETDSRQHGVAIVVVRQDRNRGKGRAIRTGLDCVTCTHVIIQDADLEYDSADIDKLWNVMRSGQTDVVYGSRYLEKSQLQSGRVIFQSGVRLLNLITRLRYGVCLTDQATCYKMLRTTDLRRMNLQCERFEFCAEVTAKACLLGLSFREVTIRYTPRTELEGKKLRISDGYAAFTSLSITSRHRRSLHLPTPRRSHARVVTALLLMTALFWGWRYFAVDGGEPLNVAGEAPRSVTKQLGRLEHKQVIVAEFEFRNGSTSTWDLLTSRTSCGCTSLVVSESSVPPGGLLHGKVSILTPSLAGPFSVTSVITACAGQELKVHCSGEVIPPFLSTPAKLTVRANQPEQFRCPVLTPGTEIRLISFPSWCVVTLEKNEVEEFSGMVSIEPDRQPSKPRTGHIVLSDQRGFRQSIEVSTNGDSVLKTYPTVLHFGEVEVGSTTSRTLSIVTPTDVDGSVSPQLLTSEPQLRVQLSKSAPGATVATVHLDGKAQGLVSTKLTITVGSHILEVPVSARVAAGHRAQQR